VSVDRIPSWMLQQAASIEVYEGESGTGPLYTAAKTARCRVEPARKLVIDAKGNEVAASARAFLEPDVEVTAESLFTADGVRYTVLDVKRQINAKGEAHHLEVMLTSGR